MHLPLIGSSQALTEINLHLTRDPHARRRRLYVPGIRALPLGPSFGLMQWQQNTVNLQCWLHREHRAAYRLGRQGVLPHHM